MKALAWCASFILPLPAYLYHYTSTAHEMYKMYYISRPLFFLAFLGCAVPYRWAAALLGLVILGVCSLAVRSRFDRTNPVAFYFATWVMLTACLVAWVRGAIGFGIASRY